MRTFVPVQGWVEAQCAPGHRSIFLPPLLVSVLCDHPTPPGQPPPGLCVAPCWVQGHRTAVPRGWRIPSAIAQPVPVVFQRGWCDRCPRAHSMPHVSTWGLKIPLAPACFSAGVICRDILDPSLSLAWSH